MARAYVSIGSNIDRDNQIRQAVRSMEMCFGELELSPVYETEAVGFQGDPFLNLVAGFESALSAQETADILKQIEKQLGRTHNENKFASRTIDLDLLCYADLILNENGLKLPRPEILDYAFALKPLTDIASDDKHPVLEKSYAELWREFSGNKSLKLLNFSWI